MPAKRLEFSAQLAELIKLSQSYVHDIEKGKSKAL